MEDGRFSSSMTVPRMSIYCFEDPTKSQHRILHLWRVGEGALFLLLANTNTCVNFLINLVLFFLFFESLSTTVKPSCIHDGGIHGGGTADIGGGSILGATIHWTHHIIKELHDFPETQKK